VTIGMISPDQAAFLIRGVLALLLVGMVYWFVVPSIRLALRLSKLLNSLSVLPAEADPDAMSELFSCDPALHHLWSEYQETLHRQTRFADGLQETVAIRATILAETYFNPQTVVDDRLSETFFKHLPGIATGTGIIGTFLGIIGGLSQFLLAEANSQESVRQLMAAVRDAFEVSFLAISLAISATFVEKIALSVLYRWTQQLAHRIDSRYQAGAAEEYLTRLVIASESSATQARILKDALVDDLKAVFNEVASRQIQSTEAVSGRLSEQMATAISDSLKDPLSQIAATVDKASGDQTAAAVAMLDKVMDRFSARISEVFGGQISGINEVNQRAAQTMGDAVSALNMLVGRMEEGQRTSSEAMATQLSQTIAALQQGQLAMQEQMQGFAEQMAAAVQRAQSTIAATTTQHQETFASQTSEAVQSMTDSVDEAIENIAAAATKMADSVRLLSATSAAAIQGLNSGAATLDATVTRFTEAGSSVTAVMQSAQVVSSRLAELTGGLVSASTALQSTIRDFGEQRESNERVVTEFRAILEAAKREASMTDDVLKRLEESSAKLKRAQLDAEEFLKGVSDVLTESTDVFRQTMAASLSEATTGFHDTLTQAVQLTASAVGNLEDSVEDLNLTLQKLQAGA